MGHDTIAPDRSVPFVRAVLDVMEGKGGLEAAIDALVAAEARCGVALWTDLAGKDSELGAGAFVPREPANPPDLREVMELVRSWESFERVFTASEQASGSVDARLTRLLGETHLVLAGVDFSNDHFVRSEEGAVAAWTQRAWGAFVARWANALGWGPHFNKRGDPYAWDYVDFYTQCALERYEQWEPVVREVLHQKTLRALGGG